MKNLFLLALCLTMGAPMIANSNEKQKTAFFAGGCFWCMEPPFEKQNGVINVVAGYMGGRGEQPTYQTYAKQGYVEVVKIVYNPQIVLYNTLLDIFWKQIDPTDANGQFVDRGPQYRSAIFYQNETQQKQAEASKKQLQISGRFSKPIVTEILPASTFYPAEEYHQNYAKKNPIRYKFYRFHSGRDRFLKRSWSKKLQSSFNKPSAKELLKRLTPIQYQVTQHGKTEPPFKNPYWDNTRAGIYVDIVSGEPLFSSLDKFKSGTGWPSFSKPLAPNNIVEQKRGIFFTTIEVRSKHADSHLGDVFKDGPPPTGLRYCINSASLRFIPAEHLEQEGYGKYKKLFEKH